MKEELGEALTPRQKALIEKKERMFRAIDAWSRLEKAKLEFAAVMRKLPPEERAELEKLIEESSMKKTSNLEDHDDPE